MYPSLPLAHFVQFKEEYKTVKILLDALKYKEYCWEVIGDFKKVAFLMGLQGGFTKYPCYLSLWDNRDTVAFYLTQDSPQRTEFSVGKNNVNWESLLDPRNVLFPSLYLKLGLMKPFVRALDKEYPASKHVQDFFPNLSATKFEACVLIGPQINKVMECKEFPQKNSQGRRE